MDKLQALIERLATSFLLSVLMLLVSFSFMTGKFPPQKSDLLKAIEMMKGMYSSTLEVQAAQRELLDSNGEPVSDNLTQMIDFQKANLRRSEYTQELMALFPRIQSGVGSMEVQEALLRIQNHLDEVEKDLQVVTAHYSQLGKESE